MSTRIAASILTAENTTPSLSSAHPHLAKVLLDATAPDPAIRARTPVVSAAADAFLGLPPHARGRPRRPGVARAEPASRGSTVPGISLAQLPQRHGTPPRRAPAYAAPRVRSRRQAPRTRD